MKTERYAPWNRSIESLLSLPAQLFNRPLVGWKIGSGNPALQTSNVVLYQSAAVSRVMAERYDYGNDRAKLVAGVDDFYKDSLNTRIPIEFALQYVRDTLNGKNAPRDLEKQLDEWRVTLNKQTARSFALARDRIRAVSDA